MITVSSPLGPLTVETAGGAITALRFSGGVSDVPEPADREAARQLEAYFQGARQSFDLPVAPAGTSFQRTVWAAMAQIPYGETVTYGELAARIGRPGAARAVGRACGANPIPVILPCHRVVGKNGALTGYAGGLERKRLLLALERNSRRGE